MEVDHPDYKPWRDSVPALIDDCVSTWKLTLGEPYQWGYGGYTARAAQQDGTPCVLKLVFPHRESKHEADALALWDGDGAVRVLARDDSRHAMLLERCEPGTSLSSRPASEALEVFIGLLPRLWKPAGDPFATLEDEVEHWLEEMPRGYERVARPFERGLLDTAIDALGSLATTQGEAVLLHQDLHGQNVLAAQREPWLVIDPKPLVGEREFSVAPIVRDFDLGHSKAEARGRLDRLTADLDLDRERARLWTIGQTIAWCFDSTYLETHVETVRWLL